MSLDELQSKITSAPWYPFMLLKLAESVGILSGAPNSGKSSLVVNIAKRLGLTRTRTTSRNFWLYAKDQRPYFSMWLFCTDSFYSEEEPPWDRMKQLLE